MNKKKRLDYNSFVLIMGNKELRPILDRSSYFLDYAAPYFNEYIKENSPKDYVLVYEIDKKDIKKSFKLKVLSSFNMKKNKMVTRYALVDLSPVILDELTDIKETTTGNKINFSNTNVGNTILTVNDYVIGSNYIYSTGDCSDLNVSTCTKDVVSVNYNIAKNDATLLVLGYDFDLDEETSYAKNLKNKLSFFEDFITVKVGNTNSTNEYNVTNITPKNLNDKIVLQVDGSIKNESILDILITIRNKRYTIKLR